MVVTQAPKEKVKKVTWIPKKVLMKSLKMTSTLFQEVAMQLFSKEEDKVDLAVKVIQTLSKLSADAIDLIE